MVASISTFMMTYYIFKDKKKLMLDARDQQNQTYSEVENDIRELTPWIPYTMDHVEEYLRSRQNSVRIGGTGGMLRLDRAWSESNMPVEDTMDFLAVADGDERIWSILGTFDGHWQVLAYSSRGRG